MLFMFRIMTSRAAGDESSMGKQSLGHPLAGLVERGGFEPPKASPTELQSVPFGRSGTSPTLNPFFWANKFHKPQNTAKSIS